MTLKKKILRNATKGKLQAELNHRYLTSKMKILEKFRRKKTFLSRHNLHSAVEIHNLLPEAAMFFNEGLVGIVLKVKKNLMNLNKISDGKLGEYLGHIYGKEI